MFTKFQKNIHTNIIFLVLLVGLPSSLYAAEYKIAIRAHQGVEKALKRWRATAQYLSNQIPEHSFKLMPIVDLNEITSRAERSEFDFVLTNPSSYVELKHNFNAQAIATLNNKRANTSQQHFGSVIFVHASNESIINLNDLKEKTLMSVSKSAFGGWRVAWLELLKNGINPYTDCKSVQYAKNSLQPEVVYAVRDKKVDAGVVRTDQLERMEAEGKIDMRNFRIINNKDVKNFPFFLSTELYPEWAFAAMKNIPKKVSKKVHTALLSMKKESNAAQIGHYTGWSNANDYSSVESLMRQLRVGSFKY